MPNDPSSLPPISKELVEALERMFPDRLPESPMFSSQGVAFDAGCSKVVRKIRYEFERQTMGKVIPSR
jgi:hypothetical protein